MKLQSILVVEDELIVAKHIEKQLIKSGYKVTAIVNNGKSALKEIKRIAPDLILMDVRIEGDLDGIETSALINKKYKIPIVYLTAFTEKNTIDRAKTTEPYGYIIKPFSAKNLETTVEIAYHKFQIEKKLRDSESWLINTMDHLADAVITTESDGQIKYLNPVAEGLTEWANTKAKGKKLQDVFVLFEEYNHTPITNVLEYIINSENKDYSYSILKSKQGKELIVGYKAAYIKEDNRENIGIVIVFQDFTQQRLAEQKLIKSHHNLEKKVIENDMEIRSISQDLKTSEQKYKTFIENVFDLICEVNTDGSFSYVNNNYKKLFTYTKDELLGKKIFDFIYNEDLDDFKDRFNNSARNNVEFSHIYRSNTKDGDLIWLESTGNTVQDSEGKPFMLIVSRDITEKKKFEEQRIKSDRLDSLGILAGGIAHDFNNLITVVLGNTSLMRLNTEFSGENMDKLAAIEKASKRARDLTLQLLTFSKGGSPVKKKIGEIDNIIKDTARFVLSGSNINCHFHFSNDFWKIEADEGQISQVISNLIINSKQAMSKGGNLNISLENTKHANSNNSVKIKKYIKITIQDAGSGIDPENLQKIFDPYFTTKQTGTGLGLATCYTIIKNHGGFIEVDSELGVGTSFYIYLPAIESESNNPANIDGNMIKTRTNSNLEDKNLQKI